MLFEHDRGQQSLARYSRAVSHGNGASGCVIASQFWQLNFSRTVSITLNRRGVSSSVAVTSSPSLDSLLPP
jgi:hypothetical protein